MTPLARAGGVVGPAAFVAAWVGTGGGRTDAISELAALGASTRPWMTAGMVAFGVGVPLFGLGVRGAAGVAAGLAGLGSLAVAALPLDPGRDVPAHGVAAGFAYVATAAIPLLASRRVSGRWRAWSIAAGVVGGACLAGSASNGVLQRVGLTILDVWIVSAAVAQPMMPASRSSATRSP